jgi:sigma-54-interacting transcriptional regulator
LHDELASRWHPPLTVASVKDEAASQPPVFLPIDLHTEWNLVVRGHHHLMLVGTPSVTNDLLVAMKPHLRDPLHEYTPSAGGSVPQPSDGTLVLSEVARLDAKQQRQLLQWLDQVNEDMRVQVVSTTAEPLFSLVQAGAFLVDLYYKLNVVLLNLTRPGERS